MPSVTLSPERRKQLIGAGMLLVYAVLTLIGATHHELWFDEAQAWGIARDATLDTFTDILRHEGHPALWYLILMPFAKAGMHCEVINIISWLFSVAAAGLFVWKAPFGIVFKAAVLFSSGFLYFNSVNSRVYCLIPLLLFLIAIVYPKRDKYAPIYGLLVGLLANTHIMMCGLVGVLGIFMLIELVQGIRRDGLKKSAGKIAGLVIAGVLVIAMILPLLGSLSSNNMVNENSISAFSLITGPLWTFAHIGVYLTPEANAFGAILGIFLILALAALFSYKRAFIMSVAFTVMYGVIIEGIWYTTQLRAPVFLYTFVAIFWIAVENEKPRKLHIPDKNLGSIGKKLILGVKKFYSAPKKTVSLFLGIMLFASLPAGAYWLYYDCFNETVKSESAAKFISEKLPQDAVVIVGDQACIQINAYTPKTRFYSLELQRFITFSPHEIAPETPDKAKIRSDLSDFPNLYFVRCSDKPREDTSEQNNRVYCESAEKTPPYAFSGTVEILKVSLDELIKDFI